MAQSPRSDTGSAAELSENVNSVLRERAEDIRDQLEYFAFLWDYIPSYEDEITADKDDLPDWWEIGGVHDKATVLGVAAHGLDWNALWNDKDLPFFGHDPSSMPEETVIFERLLLLMDLFYESVGEGTLSGDNRKSFSSFNLGTNSMSSTSFLELFEQEKDRDELLKEKRKILHLAAPPPAPKEVGKKARKSSSDKPPKKSKRSDVHHIFARALKAKELDDPNAGEKPESADSDDSGDDNDDGRRAVPAHMVAPSQAALARVDSGIGISLKELSKKELAQIRTIVEIRTKRPKSERSREKSREARQELANRLAKKQVTAEDVERIKKKQKSGAGKGHPTLASLRSPGSGTRPPHGRINSVALRDLKPKRSRSTGGLDGSEGSESSLLSPRRQRSPLANETDEPTSPLALASSGSAEKLPQAEKPGSSKSEDGTIGKDGSSASSGPVAEKRKAGTKKSGTTSGAGKTPGKKVASTAARTGGANSSTKSKAGASSKSSAGSSSTAKAKTSSSKTVSKATAASASSSKVSSRGGKVSSSTAASKTKTGALASKTASKRRGSTDGAPLRKSASADELLDSPALRKTSSKTSVSSRNSDIVVGSSASKKKAPRGTSRDEILSPARPSRRAADASAVALGRAPLRKKTSASSISSRSTASSVRSKASSVRSTTSSTGSRTSSTRSTASSARSSGTASKKISGGAMSAGLAKPSKKTSATKPAAAAKDALRSNGSHEKRAAREADAKRADAHLAVGDGSDTASVGSSGLHTPEPPEAIIVQKRSPMADGPASPDKGKDTHKMSLEEKKEYLNKLREQKRNSIRASQDGALASVAAQASASASSIDSTPEKTSSASSASAPRISVSGLGSDDVIDGSPSSRSSTKESVTSDDADAAAVDANISPRHLVPQPIKTGKLSAQASDIDLEKEVKSQLQPPIADAAEKMDTSSFVTIDSEMDEAPEQSAGCKCSVM